MSRPPYRGGLPMRMRLEDTRSCTVSEGICRSSSVRAARSLRTGTNSRVRRRSSSPVRAVSRPVDDTAFLLILLLSAALKVLPARADAWSVLPAVGWGAPHRGVRAKRTWAASCCPIGHAALCRGGRDLLRDEGLDMLDHAGCLGLRPACQAVWHILEQR